MGPAAIRTGLVGRRIMTSLSPPLHEREAAELGLELSYELFDLAVLDRPDHRVTDVIRDAARHGFAGLNVTHPCKRLALSALDELAPSARAIGAVNTVVLRDGQAVGHSTDGIGFVSALDAVVPVGSRRDVVLVGAGGAGASIAQALLATGTERLVVVDADRQRSRELVDAAMAWSAGVVAAGSPADLADLLAGADGLVHATPIGMADHPGMAVPAAALRPDRWVAEVVYRPTRTTLLREAERLGCTVVDGVGMVVHQAAEAFRLFTGVDPDADRMMRHARELIAAEDATAGMTRTS